MVKNSFAIAGDLRDVGAIPGQGRYSGEGHGNSLHYSWLEISIHTQRSLGIGVGTGAMVSMVAKSWTQLK